MKIAAIQMNSVSDERKNRARIEALVEEAAQGGASFVVLPEVAFYRGARAADGADTIPGRHSQFLAELAVEHRLWIHAGSIAEQVAGIEKPYNTSFVVDPAGAITAVYRKINLFKIFREDSCIKESDSFTPGSETSLVEIDGITIGLLICYDLRFGELWRELVESGAQVILCPANFTWATGEAHWETLLRARAIESQAYVVAPAQWGEHPGKGFSAFGRAMIVGPWGEVIVVAENEGDRCLIADVDSREVDRIRKMMPLR